jgi:hypothetical protein
VKLRWRWWRRKQRPVLSADPLAGRPELIRYLHILYGAVHPRYRGACWWVMDARWFEYITRTLTLPGDQQAGITQAQPVILGTRVRVLPDGGWPHLEPPSRVPDRAP